MDLMNDDEFHDWYTCVRVNLHFHESTKNIKYAHCIVCFIDCGRNERSTFWRQATNCSAGHSQVVGFDTWSAICNACDENYIYDVLKRKHTCRREGCRRVVRVNEIAAREKLRWENELLTEFLELVSRSQVYECAIHLGDVALSPSFYETVKPPTSQCDHDRNVCDECLKATLESAIRGGNLQSLTCPDPECRATLPKDRVKKYVSRGVFKIYNDQLAIQAALNFPNFRWCDCGHGQIHEPGESNPEWRCLRCKQRSCYICINDSSRSCDHLARIDAEIEDRKRAQRRAAMAVLAMADKEDERARNADKRERDMKRKAAQENEAANAATVARISKLCPRAGCGLRIQRINGCAHFTCAKCSTHFCWCCKAIWPSGLARIHVTGCRFAGNSGVSKWRLNISQYTPDWDKDYGYDTNLDRNINF